tara:strand:- start:1091 stop:1258 length:168 start_codon:yes stop_codon:yes gene_type:complete
MKQLDLFENQKEEWEKFGFATREEWLKAKAFDRAFKHMEQVAERQAIERAKNVKT